ncbi:ClpXP protease specificity-enhancing factor SspB [Limisalsivibrio acetivorans]|uniref:ClpXP protease specificity-enhancing factor SspB n=1 Tax=Limisalsivibrio acetivorans TaxID=1304888 RepID=UPI0003B72086|nr:ClpXP protease specificity-enhancing factor SspB [Limisalsivibrio acetivorans]
MDTFKKDIIDRIFEHYTKFFLHLAPHPGLVIGNRGLVGEEKERGIVLVLGEQSYRDMSVEEEFISVKMKFGGVWEQVFIPYEAISAAFNDPVSPEFMFNFKPLQEETPEKEEKHEVEKEDNVIKPKFGKD